MKEATGELSMTVITIIAVVAIAGIIALAKDPVTKWIENTFNDLTKEESNTGIKNPIDLQ